MIAESLRNFIWSQTELQGSGLGLLATYAKIPDVPPGELRAPYALVSRLKEMKQELWEIGDVRRKENPLFAVAFYCTTREQMEQFRSRFRRLIESATAVNTDNVTAPGINFIAYADLLRDSGDHLTYYSDQLGWFSSPTPVIYKNEDSNGEPVVVASGYSVNSTAGSVTFSQANLAADRIRAYYKFGSIDFDIADVDDFETAPVSDLANNPARYVVVFALEPHFYIKKTANKYL